MNQQETDFEIACKELQQIWIGIAKLCCADKWEEALFALKKPCRLCDYYQRYHLRCSLAVWTITCLGRSMRLCSCNPTREVVRWELGRMVRRGAKFSVKGSHLTKIEAAKIIAIVLKAEKQLLLVKGTEHKRSDFRTASRDQSSTG